MVVVTKTLQENNIPHGEREKRERRRGIEAPKRWREARHGEGVGEIPY